MQTFIFEEHHEVLAHWFGQGIRGRTIVCLDAHLDLQQIPTEKIERLRECESLDQVAALAKPHHLLPDADFCFSIENFFYAAHQLGIVDHLVWVAPPYLQIADTTAAVAQLKELDGMTPEMIDSAVVSGVPGATIIHANVLGVPLTVCDLTALPRLDLPKDCILDVDIDYFVGLPEDRLGVDPAVVAAFLRSQGLLRGSITLSRSVQSGFTPFRYRMLAEYLSALFREDHVESERLKRLLHAAYLMDVGDLAAAKRLVATDQATRAEMLQTVSGSIETPRGESSRIACGIIGRRLECSVARVEELAVQASEEISRDDVGPVDEAITFSAIGLLWCLVGNIDRAVECVDRIQRGKCVSRELYLEIGKALQHAGQRERAAAYLECCLIESKTQTSALMCLAELAYQAGDVNEAKQLARQAADRAPAWDLPRELLYRL